MLSYKIETRTNDTNATGHIDHTVIPVWFELARTPIYELLNPGLSLAKWNTVIRKIDIDYLGQVLHGKDTEVRSCIGAIKNTSFQVLQELRQTGVVAAKGSTVLVCFDYKGQQKMTIPPAVREQLAAWQEQSGVNASR